MNNNNSQSKEFLDVFLVQTDLAWENPKANRMRLEWHLKQIPPASLVVLPEMYATGFTMQPELFAEGYDGDTINWMKEKSDGITICGSLSFKSDGKFYNKFLAVRDGEIVCDYNKRHLFSYANEHEHYSAGDQMASFDCYGFQIVPQVCFDLRFPGWIRKSMMEVARKLSPENNRESFVENWPDVLLVVANWPQSRVAAWDALLQARAIENQSYVVAVNRVGKDENGISHNGHSQVVGFDGQYRLLPFEKEGMAHVVIEKKPLQLFRNRFPFIAEADFEL